MGDLAVEHALTRSVRDSAALLDATSGPSVDGERFAGCFLTLWSVGRARAMDSNAIPTGRIPSRDDCDCWPSLSARCAEHNLETQGHDLSNQIFEIDHSKLDRKSNEVLWSPADRPAKPLATSDWVVDDIGAAFSITVKLSGENAIVDLQLPHPQDVGSLPARASALQTRRRY